MIGGICIMYEKKDEISLKTIIDIRRELLEAFHELCIKNKYTYSISFGTLLGAVRHKGMIPWDDDIDIMMPRKDYENLLLYAETHNDGRYIFVNHRNHPAIKTRITYFTDSNTITVMYGYENETNEYKGIHIDIFPVDQVPINKRQRYILITKRNILLKLFKGCDLHPKYHKNIAKRYAISILHFICSLYGADRALYNLDKVCSYYSLNNKTPTNSCSILIGYGSPKIFNNDIMENIQDYEFDGHLYKGIADYDIFLKAWYGNYMTLPPIEKRISNSNPTTKNYWKKDRPDTI